MSSIVAGRFASVADAEEVARKLYARGFSVWDVSIMSLAGDGPRGSGVLLAARAKGDRRDEAADVLQEGGAADLESASGKWEGGQWIDFDAGSKPSLMEAPGGGMLARARIWRRSRRASRVAAWAGQCGGRRAPAPCRAGGAGGGGGGEHR
ncbi:hypothetical protein DFLDMN_005498 [Cupriavidus sp. H19C3]|uniref:hypothetical protein n=1 Tax=Cupriavidus sp. H19C3 TaxID=3241603 RepID=UPI003BF83E4A